MTVTSELQTTTTPSVNGAYSPSVRTHKVTVNDRQRGVVHEFVVPEVNLSLSLSLSLLSFSFLLLSSLEENSFSARTRESVVMLF